jgi:hypothetical protein
MIARDYDNITSDMKDDETNKQHSEKMKGHKVSKKTRRKMSKSAKKANTEELRKAKSEARKDQPHPHKSGRKGEPISEFGKIFYKHYKMTSAQAGWLYNKELQYWREHDKTPSWVK